MNYLELFVIGGWLCLIVGIAWVQLYALRRADDLKHEAEPSFFTDTGILLLTMRRTSYAAIVLYLLPLIAIIFTVPNAYRYLIYVVLVCFSFDGFIQVYTRTKPGRKRVVQAFKYSIYYLVAKGTVEEHYIDYSFVLRFMRSHYKRKKEEAK